MSRKKERRERVSLIIPVHNGGEKFERCLRSVDALNPPPDETIVVTDGCTDNSAAIALEHGAKVLTLKTNQGPAKARNIGAAKASGDILFFLDADVQARSNVIGLARKTLQEHPETSAIFGSYDDKPSEPDFFSQYRNLLHHYVHQTSSKKASTFWAGCGAIRRKAFLKVRGFDETLRPVLTVEDVEMGYRLVEAGFAIRLYKTLKCKHLKRWTLGSIVVSDTLHRAMPWTELLLARRGRMVNELNLQASNRASVALSALLVFALLLGHSNLLWGWAAAACGAALIILNQGLYRFFYRERGFLFLLGAVPMHWIHFLCSGLGLVIGACRFWWKK